MKLRVQGVRIAPIWVKQGKKTVLRQGVIRQALRDYRRYMQSYYPLPLSNDSRDKGLGFTAKENAPLQTASLLWFLLEFLNFNVAQKVKSSLLCPFKNLQRLLTSPREPHLLGSYPEKMFRVPSVLQQLPKSRKFHLKWSNGSCHFLFTMKSRHLEGTEYRRVMCWTLSLSISL